MDFDKIDEEWNRVSFALDTKVPEQLRVDMFVRVSPGQEEEPDSQNTVFDIGWAREFTGENSCNFMSLDQVSRETGVDFSLLSLGEQWEEAFMMERQSRKDVLFLHALSRYWAIKNGLLHKLKEKDEEGEATGQEEHAPVQAQSDPELSKKIRKLEKMTFKLLKQNHTIYKTLKKQGAETFLSRLFK